MKQAVTAQEVATLAGVSQSAVSRTFTDGASVSPAMRAKVLAAAQSLGYRPNAIARSLITRHSRMIALGMHYLDNQFYPQVMEQLSHRLQALGYHLLMFIGEAGQHNADAVLDDILQYQVDGIVLASSTLSPELARNCAAAGVPVVLLNRVAQIGARPLAGTSSVTADNRRGGQLVAQHLVRQGYRRIAYLAGLDNASTSIERERGLQEGLRQAGLCLHSRACGHYSFSGAQQAMRTLLAQRERPDAVFVANDHMALAAMDVIRLEHGLRVPHDLAVVGFDDIPQAAWGSYQLTTVLQDVDAMVQACVDLLMGQMHGPLKGRHLTVPCQLVQRSSA
jgi:DNA-binding LacI/PurR family transcriptional regulator